MDIRDLEGFPAVATRLNKDEFIETFALAAPGREFETYSETRFRRKRQDLMYFQ